MTTATDTTFEKATIYTTGEFFGNIQKIEVRRGSVEVKPYAQHTDAVHVKFVPKGGRRLRGFVKSYKPFVMIVKGHGHPEPAELFGKTISEGDGVTVKQGTYAAFDERWVEDFKAANDFADADVIFARDDR